MGTYDSAVRFIPRRRRATNPATTRPQAALTMPADLAEAFNEGTQSGLPLIATPAVSRQARAAYFKAQASTYAELYRAQPSVRKVIDYIARNAGQIGLKLYERLDDDDRREASDHEAAAVLHRPNSFTTKRRFLASMVSDFLIYENAYAFKIRPSRRGRIRLVRVPVYAVEVNAPSQFVPDVYRVHLRNGETVDVDPADVIHFRGYDPDDPLMGVSRLETLRLILAEDATNAAANVERLQHGGVGGGYIKRGLDAPAWSPEARERFETDWARRSKGRRKGERVDPVLEEGMEFVETSVTPREAEMLRGRIFTRAEVASLYGLPAVLVEAADQASDDDRAKARDQFYADCLPPLLTPMAEELDLQLLEDEYAADDHYFEWNMADKLRGMVEERFKTLVTAAGAPILTRNEARARENLQPKDGGDELITPMNVTVGGKPSPNTMPVQDPNAPSQDGDERKALMAAFAALLDAGVAPPAIEAPNREVDTSAVQIARRQGQAERRDRYADEHAELLRDAFARQERVYKSSGKFDVERWNAELADDLEDLALRTVEREGGIAAERVALPTFDLDRCREYLRRGAEERAAAINATTANDLEADRRRGGARRAAEDEGDEPQTAFERATGDRAPQAGLAMATGLAGFAHLEAGKQTPDAASRLKTWVVMSANSRHPDLDGESVPLDGVFSNGAAHPGDPSLDVAETARCQCLMEVT